tara:strand:+ start:462 stop:977 length:516 start_codon:yes stop_codon:yes gene_type:complete
MSKKVTPLIIICSLLFILIIFYKSLNKSSLYEPESKINNIPEFTAKILFENKELTSKQIFNQNKFYLFNIWASWCLPCRDEHPLLVNLNKFKQLEIIGLNYKDDPSNAKKFLKKLGNPYKKILLDRNGTIAIEWGAFGVPESFLIHEGKIIKKFIGPLDVSSVKEINKFIK